MSHTGDKSPSNNPFAQFQQTPTNKASSIFSLHASKKSGKLISHLLGLDHAQSSSAGTNSHVLAFFKSIKLSDLFQGVKFTPTFMFFLLFFGFFLWIFVIYWVRHHEPLANQVLGSSKADAQKALADRRLVNGIKNAFPVQTSSSTGEIYVPGVAPVPPQQVQVNVAQQSMPAAVQTAPTQGNVAQPQAYAGGYQVSAAPVMLASPSSSASVPAQFGTAAAAPQVPLSTTPMPMNAYGRVVMPISAASPGAVPAASAYPAPHTNYMVGVPSSSGPRLKTIVNR